METIGLGIVAGFGARKFVKLIRSPTVKIIVRSDELLDSKDNSEIIEYIKTVLKMPFSVQLDMKRQRNGLVKISARCASSKVAAELSFQLDHLEWQSNQGVKVVFTCYRKILGIRRKMSTSVFTDQQHEQGDEKAFYSHCESSA